MRFPDNRQLKITVLFKKQDDFGTGLLNAINKECDMKRNDFFKTCGAGICGCGVLGLLAPLAARAEDTAAPAAAVPVDPEMLKQQLEGARERFARLLAVMGEQLDDATRGKILQGLGHECAKDYGPLFSKYRGDLPGFLEKIKTAWVERTEYDEKTGVLRVVGKPAPCGCPLVKAGRTTAEFCDCSRGWTQAAFSTVLGKPVTVEIEESALRGGSRCSFRVGTKG
jgi:predicted hydrocarbon binding protein